jgi:hypothetical protein
MSDEFEEMQDSKQKDIADCWRICRNFQDYGAKKVMRKIKQHFHNKTEEEVLELIIEVEKLTRENSIPNG